MTTNVSRYKGNRKTLAAMVSAITAVGLTSIYSPVASAAEMMLEEITVTARRSTENLQDIPVSAQMISGEQLDSLAMVSPTEITKLTPGLSLYLPEPGAPVMVLRGIRWTPGSGTPAVPIYYNEAPFDPGQTLITMYDIGQVEVLKGPQGTARGAPSISGAITLTTRRPDFEGINGYVSGLVGEDSHMNLQAAVNIPLIEDKLAMRIAGNFDDSEGNGVKSVNSSQDPSVELKSGRLSLRYAPTDTVMIDFMAQRLDSTGDIFPQVDGPGSPGVGGGFIAPANYNGPAISLEDRLAVADGVSLRPILTDLYTINASWEIPGHTISANYGSQKNKQRDPNGYTADPGNLMIGFNPISNGVIQSGQYHEHYEVRLSSLRDGDRMFDYDVGLYGHRADSRQNFINTNLSSFAAFSLGVIPSPNFPTELTDRYSVTSISTIHLRSENESAYGNLVWHISDETELTVGVRHIKDIRPSDIATVVPSYFAPAAPEAALGGLTCDQAGAFGLIPGGVASPIYPGICDAVVAASTQPFDSNESEESATIYNVSLAHHFTDDILGYVTVGSSWRSGLPSIANIGLPSSLALPAPEEATSYEIGVKTQVGDRVRVNANIYQIDYTDQLNQFKGTQYFDNVSIPGQIRGTNTAFFSNLDAQVQGAELDIQALPVDNLTLGLNLSYAKIEAEGGSAPCNDPSRPLNATNIMNFCPVTAGTTTNGSPEFQASFNGSYFVPFDGGLEGYGRFVANYQGENENFGSSVRKADAFTIVDLYFGVQDAEGVWDIGFYGKNVFDEITELSRTDITTGVGGIDQIFGPSGYQNVTSTLPRELGVSFRYNFSAN